MRSAALKVQEATAGGAVPSTGQRGSRAVFPVLALVVVAVNLPQSVVVPVLPGLQESYGSDPVTVTWLITGFLLSSAVATPLMGRLADTYGQRRILAAALIVLSAGCLGASLAPSIGWLIAMRVVQGISGGAVPVTFSALRVAVPPKQLSYGAAVLATVGSIAFSVGIVVAGPLLVSTGRAAVFLLPMVLAVVALVGVLVVMPAGAPETRTAGGRFGVLPVALFGGALVCALLAISQSTNCGGTSPIVLALIGGCLVLGFAWALQERRATVPFIDLRMMRRRGMWTASLVAFLAGVGLFGCAAGLPRLLQAPPESGAGVGASLREVGLLMSPIAFSAFLTSLCTGRLYQRFSSRALVVAGGLVSGASFAGLAFWNGERWQVVAWCVLQGIGNGLILSTVAAVVMNSVPANETGVANGMNTNIRTLGGSLGAAATASILTAYASSSAVDGAGHAGGSGSADFVDGTGYVAVFLVLAGAMVASAAAAVLIPRDPTRAPGRESEPAASGGGPGHADSTPTPTPTPTHREAR
ncbi:MFS transporter [Parafrankia sp. FMc2]|uniref:MFS transporter n=1 Tax=Parafrankia sp. FMc2 TaxID=3233196 RepID=UPI0034D42FBA